jgi:O-antigen/teichoic acid export membrane protein
VTIIKISQKLPNLTKILSDDGLSKKAYLNATTSILEYGARLLVNFITIPIVVSGLGNYSYGLWQILNQAIGYISSTSAKPTQALKWSLANQQTSDDFESKRRYVGSTIAVWIVFFPVLAVIGGILSWFLPVWLNVPLSSFWPVRIAAGILVLNLIMKNLSSLPRSVLLGENLGYKRMGLSALLVLIGGALTLVAVYLRTGLVGLAATVLITTILGGILFLLVVKKYSPWFGVARASSDILRNFFRLSIWFMAWDLIFSVMIASDVVLLGLLKSVESVTSYTLTKHAPDLLISIIAIMVNGILPGLGGIIGSGDIEKASKIRNEIMTFSWLALTFLGSAILLWNQVFLNLWVGAHQYIGTISNFLVVIFVIQFVLIQNDADIINLSLRIQWKVLIGALSVGLSLVVAGLLVGRYNLGVEGLLLGLIVGRSILSIGYPILVGQFLKIPLSSQLKSLNRPFIAMSVLFILATILSENLAIQFTITGLHGWFLFGFSACVTAVIFFFVAFYSGLASTQRQAIVRRVRMIIYS